MLRGFVRLLGAVALAPLLHFSGYANAAEAVEVDFVTDRPFPASAKKKREFGKSLDFTVSGVTVTVTGENEFGGAEEVSRRGPGGLGVKGNGDRNAAGEGTTSGNRVNNGEHLIVTFADATGAPLKVVLKSIVFDRVVRDEENFGDVGQTGYRLLADGNPISAGDLPAGKKPFAVSVDHATPVATLRVTNSESFHAIANRFRVTGMTFAPAD